MSAFATSIRKPRRDTPLITRSIAESYDVGPRIGKGAYGTVFRCVDKVRAAYRSPGPAVAAA